MEMVENDNGKNTKAKMPHRINLLIMQVLATLKC